MDGGRKKWELDSRELTDELPERAATSYTARSRVSHPWPSATKPSRRSV